MKINREELREAFRQAQNIATEELETGMPETDEKMEGQDWQTLYEIGQAQKEKKGIWKGSRRSMRIAMVVTIVLVVGTASVFSSEAGRRAMMQWFTEWGDKDDGFHFSGDSEKTDVQPPQEIETVYEPTWIPDGFELTEDEMVGGLDYFQEYMNGMHYIGFEQDTVNAGITIDSDGMLREEVMVNGYQGQLNSKEGKAILIWATGEYIFTVGSDLGKEVVLKVAESVKAKEN